MIYRERETGRLFSSWQRVQAARRGMSLPLRPSAEAENAANVDRVVTPPRPEAGPDEKIVKTAAAEQDDGTWAFGWQAIPLTEKEVEDRLGARKADKRAAVDDELARQYAAGFTFDFAANTAANEAVLPDGTVEAAGVRTLQVRTDFDRNQWNAVAQAAQFFIGQGRPGEPMRALRATDDARVKVTAQEALTAMMALQAWAGHVQEHSWDLKDEAASAASLAELDKIDVKAGWERGTGQ